MLKLFSLFLFGALFLPTGWAQDNNQANLLQNGDFSQFSGSDVEDWLWPPTFRKALGDDEKFVKTGVREDASGEPHLYIETTEPIRAHVWMQQEVECFGGNSYTLNVRVAGDLEDGAYSAYDVGIYFLTADGGWLGYDRSSTPRALSPDWTPVTVTTIAPDDAVKIGVRVGIDVVDSVVAARFADAVLTLEP